MATAVTSPAVIAAPVRSAMDATIIPAMPRTKVASTARRIQRGDIGPTNLPPAPGANRPPREGTARPTRGIARPREGTVRGPAASNP